MRIPKGIAQHPAVKAVHTGDDHPEYRFEVELKEGWHFTTGRNAGGRFLFINTVGDLAYAQPRRTERNNACSTAATQEHTMKTMWIANFSGLVQEVQVERETEKFVWRVSDLAGTRGALIKEARNTAWHSYHDSKFDAQVVVLAKLREAEEIAHRRLQNAREELSAFKRTLADETVVRERETMFVRHLSKEIELWTPQY